MESDAAFLRRSIYEIIDNCVQHNAKFDSPKELYELVFAYPITQNFAISAYVGVIDLALFLNEAILTNSHNIRNILPMDAWLILPSDYEKYNPGEEENDDTCYCDKIVLDPMKGSSAVLLTNETDLVDDDLNVFNKIHSFPTGTYIDPMDVIEEYDSDSGKAMIDLHRAKNDYGDFIWTNETGFETYNVADSLKEYYIKDKPDPTVVDGFDYINADDEEVIVEGGDGDDLYLEGFDFNNETYESRVSKIKYVDDWEIVLPDDENSSNQGQNRYGYKSAWSGNNKESSGSVCSAFSSDSDADDETSDWWKGVYVDKSMTKNAKYSSMNKPKRNKQDGTQSRLDAPIPAQTQTQTSGQQSTAYTSTGTSRYTLGSGTDIIKDDYTEVDYETMRYFST